MTAENREEEANLWHRRLSHASMKLLQKLENKNLVRGLPHQRYENGKLCVACTKGKQTRSTFTGIREVTTTRILELIHMDLFGPTDIASINGMSNGSESIERRAGKPLKDRWSEEEHGRFLDGILLFGCEWNKIEDFVGSKTVTQIRCHAQRYSLKVQKIDLMSHDSPPLPQHNHDYPYTQKSAEEDMLALQSSIICPSPSSCLIPSCASWDDKSMLMDYTYSTDSVSSHNATILSGAKGDAGPVIAGVYNQKLGWPGSSSSSCLIHDAPEQGNQPLLHSVIPNFAEVYNLIATMIDPEISNSFEIYLQKLKEMDPITAKTALTLVKNLTINLSSPDFKPLSQWLLTCGANTEATRETDGDDDAAAAANHL